MPAGQGTPDWQQAPEHQASWPSWESWGPVPQFPPLLQPLPFGPQPSLFHLVNRSWVWGGSGQAGAHIPLEGPNTGAPTTLTGAHHGVGEELLWLQHRHALPQGAGGDGYHEHHEHHANTQLPTSPAGHAGQLQAARTCQPAPPCAACEAQARPRRSSAPGAADGFHPCRSHQGLTEMWVTTKASPQHRGSVQPPQVLLPCSGAV